MTQPGDTRSYACAFKHGDWPRLTRVDDKNLNPANCVRTAAIMSAGITHADMKHIMVVTAARVAVSATWDDDVPDDLPALEEDEKGTAAVSALPPKIHIVEVDDDSDDELPCLLPSSDDEPPRVVNQVQKPAMRQHAVDRLVTKPTM